MGLCKIEDTSSNRVIHIYIRKLSVDDDNNERFSFHGINGAIIVRMVSALLVTPTPDYELVYLLHRSAGVEMLCHKNARTMPYGPLSRKCTNI